jgi:hypothetical protein
MNKTKIIFLVMGFFVGIASILLIPKVFAHEGNNNQNLVHGCVSDVTGALRVVSSTASCGALETAIHFPATLSQLPPFACPGCDLTYSTVLVNKDLSGAWLKGANMAYGDYTGAVLVGADLKDVIADGANFRDADMTDVVFDHTALTGAIGMTTTVLTGATWSASNCPDGSNSSEHDNTCIGHLSP